MNLPVVNRDAELDRLHALADSGGHALALVTGRRRVGKTYLLANGWGDRAVFFFTASKTTPELNRRQLVEAVAAWSGEDVRPEDYPTWRTVFRLLLGLRAPAPLVVVLDEFQYLGDDEAGAVEVASELNAVWEAPRPERSFLMVLSGSAVGTMGALASGGGPLYGRFQWQGKLRPFGYWHAAELAGVADLRERALAYGVFGGTPRYLADVDPARSVAENATRLLLDPGGEVQLLVETALEQEEGLRDVAKYRAILTRSRAGRRSGTRSPPGPGSPSTVRSGTSSTGWSTSATSRRGGASTLSRTRRPATASPTRRSGSTSGSWRPTGPDWSGSRPPRCGTSPSPRSSTCTWATSSSAWRPRRTTAARRSYACRRSPSGAGGKA